MYAVSDLLRLAFIQEVTPGTTPATPAFKKLRITSEGLDFNPSTVLSNELNPARMLADSSLVSVAAGGSLGFELAWDANLNEAFQALFCSTWGTALAGGSTPAGWTTSDALWWGGQTFRAFTFEKTIFDSGGTDYFFRYPGSVFNTGSLAFQAGSLVTGQFDVMSRDAPSSDDMIAGATYSDPGNAPIMRTPLFTGLKINGIASTVCFRQLNVNMNNNYRGLSALGSLGHKDIIAGRAEVKLSGQLYFEDRTFYNYLVNQNTFAIEFANTDDQGSPKTYKFYFPKLKMATAKVVAGGVNQDLVVDFEANALYDSTYKTEMLMSR